MNILDRYGIKEVADVTFYDLNSDGSPKHPVLYLDTLKVTTIEQTAEEAEARGGKGNAALIAWDYGKEITVTIEDALFSAKSMAIMFGNGTVREYKGDGAYIMKTEQFISTGGTVPSANPGADSAGWKYQYTDPMGKLHTKHNPKFYDADGSVLAAGADLTRGNTYFCSYDVAVDGAVIEISANSFPGTYYVTGDTYARSEATGDDEFFQFIIPKAKVQSENTITLEAEGDPSVFNMNLKVLRPADGVMMKLVKYNLTDEGLGNAATLNSELYHNHFLDVNNASSTEVYTVAVNSSITLTKPAGAGNKTVSWVSGDTDIATVGASTGEVSGVAAGKVLIVASWDGGYTSYEITVTAE